jgi:hypothetical protein
MYLERPPSASHPFLTKVTLENEDPYLVRLLEKQGFIQTTFIEPSYEIEVPTKPQKSKKA